MIAKRFLEWIGVKERLHNVAAKPPLVRERDLWWASIGENVGSEMNGKSGLFSRPVLVLKKLSQGFFLVAPTTSRKHEGSWYALIRQAGKETYVCLHQARSIDYRRLSSRIGRIDESDFGAVADAFCRLYSIGKNIPRTKRGRGKSPNVSL